MRLVDVTMIVLMVVAAVHLALAQAVPATPRFEVASIKPVADPSVRLPVSAIVQNVLRITARGELLGRAALHDIIRLAYGAESYERAVAAEGGGSRLLEQQFDIRALPPPSAVRPNREDVMAMTREMLAERFGIKVRIDSELATATVLRIIKPGVLGAGLRPSPEGCQPLPVGANPYDAKFADAYLRSCILTFFNDRLRGTLTLQEFAHSLSLLARRPIVDQTGLDGAFAIDVAVAPSSFMPDGPAQLGAPRSTEPSGAPALVDALRSQMGLSARNERQPIRLFVVEHVGPLVEN